MKQRVSISGAVLAALSVAIVVVSAAFGEKPVRDKTPTPSALSVDNSIYINANQILMVVTNHGNFGRDLGGIFGNDYGTYYPYTSLEDIISGVGNRSVNYASGIWIGGVDSTSGDTLVTVSEFSSEYVPGPMAGGTFQTDRPEFRVYKLYSDSLESNPNTDYLEWPVDQGAPVDSAGHPAMIGDQMLWTVYNDADPSVHDNNNGETAPMGIEVQQTVWASDESGDIEVPLPTRIAVEHPDSSQLTVTVLIDDNDALTGHDYVVVSDTVGVPRMVWHLIDLTTGDTLLADQTDLMGGNSVVIDGFIVNVQGSNTFRSFEVVANGAGPLDPPESAAAPWEGFPVPKGVDPDGYPTEGQQVGDGMWMITTGSAGEGIDRGPYEVFLARTLRGASWYANLGYYDWEMRFTGSNDNPGVGGSYAWEAFASGNAYWVPFELWRIGFNSPDDPSDDLRLIPWIIGDGGDSLYWMSAWGPQDGSGTCGPGGCEHELSGGSNDPSTDWVYWCVPEDTTAGEAGYQAFETAMLTDPQNWDGNESRVLDRTVLVNWNGDTTADYTGGATIPSGYNQDLPEVGTVFRIYTGEPSDGEMFNFTASPAPQLTVGPEGLSIYMKYKLINKGGRNLKDVFIGSWHDPDLGTSGDDLIGCDTLEDRFFVYNEPENDPIYGSPPPTFGAKVLEGPIVPSSGDTASVDGYPVPDYRNLGMYSFHMFLGGLDPDNYQESYWCMWGLYHKYQNHPPMTYEGDTVTHQVSGDPVTGTGWLDYASGDRRMLASVGPFDFAPSDTQQLILKLAVGQGSDRLNSITALRAVLEYDPSVTGVEDDNTGTLPREFSVRQNYPNPFNPSTTIAYSLPVRAEIEIDIFNILGQRVATLEEGLKPAGEHSTMWEGKDDRGRSVATGVYFYRVKAGDNLSTKKMLLLK